MDNQTVFISYSWDNEEHKDWVLELANKLRSDGIDVILDRYYLRPGSNLSFFVENSLRKCHRILIILTPNYKKKAEMRLGGVGQEYSIINTELIKDIANNIRVIPVLKEGNQNISIPDFLQQYLYINFTNIDVFNQNYEELIREIYNKPKIEIPILGEKPKFSEEAKKKEAKTKSKIKDTNKNKPTPIPEVILGDFTENHVNTRRENIFKDKLTILEEIDPESNSVLNKYKFVFVELDKDIVPTRDLANDPDIKILPLSIKSDQTFFGSEYTRREFKGKSLAYLNLGVGDWGSYHLTVAGKFCHYLLSIKVANIGDSIRYQQIILSDDNRINLDEYVARLYKIVDIKDLNE